MSIGSPSLLVFEKLFEPLPFDCWGTCGCQQVLTRPLLQQRASHPLSSAPLTPFLTCTATSSHSSFESVWTGDKQRSAPMSVHGPRLHMKEWKGAKTKLGLFSAEHTSLQHFIQAQLGG